MLLDIYIINILSLLYVHHDVFKTIFHRNDKPSFLIIILILTCICMEKSQNYTFLLFFCKKNYLNLVRSNKKLLYLKECDHINQIQFWLTVDIKHQPDTVLVDVLYQTSTRLCHFDIKHLVDV